MKHSRLKTVQRSALLAAAVVALGTTPILAQPITPDDPGVADLRFTVNSSTGVKTISPYIYGINFFNGSSLDNSGLPVTLDRLGGNRYTGYNWETNASNAGADWYHSNDFHLTAGNANRPPGYAIEGSLDGAAAKGRGLVVTVPMAGYVAADGNGTVDETERAPSPRWKEVRAKKSSVYNPGTDPLSTSPNKIDGYVFTDELAYWVEQNKAPGQEVFYSLDNEPGIWGAPIPAGWNSGNANSNPRVEPTSRIATHPLIHPSRATYQEMYQKTIAHAAAIKGVNPDAKVFGAVAYGYAEFTSLQGATEPMPRAQHPGGDASGELNYVEWLLREVRAEEQRVGYKLMDVLDLHWYPEAHDIPGDNGKRITDEFFNTANPSAAMVEARIQAPRSLWDATYTGEISWITGCCSGGPIKLLKHVQRDIADFNPGTKIALTEYNYGGGRDISGGIAQAEVLGIFGREGVYAANLWPFGDVSSWQYTAGGFKMFLDYDGAAGNGQFGDTAVDAATSNISQSAVYASTDADDPTRMVLVAINRSTTSKTVGLALTANRRFDVAEVYQLTDASPNPVRVADVPIDLVNAFQYTMPEMSVTTLVLRSFADGDFDRNGVVNGADLAEWRSNAGQATGATFADGDNDRDGDVDGADFLAWQRGLTAAPGAQPSSGTVPEPMSFALALVACLAAAVRQRRLRV